MPHSTIEEHLLIPDSASVKFDGHVKFFDLLEQVNTLGGGIADTEFQPEMEEQKLGEVLMSTEDTSHQVSVDTITPDTSPVADAIPPVCVSPFWGESEAKTLRMSTPALCDDNSTEVVLAELSILHYKGELTFKVVRSPTFLKANKPDGKSDKLQERLVVRGDQQT